MRGRRPDVSVAVNSWHPWSKVGVVVGGRAAGRLWVRVQAPICMGGHSGMTCLVQTQPLDEGNRVRGRRISGKLHVIDWDQCSPQGLIIINEYPLPSTSRYLARCLYVGAIDEARCSLSWCNPRYICKVQSFDVHLRRKKGTAPPYL